MRKALVIGIDRYEFISSLRGCVNDARAVSKLLERHEDGAINFGVRLLVCEGANDKLSRGELKEAVRELFASDGEVALLYFAGHGYVEIAGGYLCASDSRTGDDGLALSEIMTLANKSAARNKVIILDSCHGGIAGDHPIHDTIAEISHGVTILTASTKDQVAVETGAGGVFTGLLVDALSGAAANLMGDITPGSVYAHIDQSLGTWAQRPVFKTHVKTFVSLRKVFPPLTLSELRRIAEFFPTSNYDYPLDPSYEPESANPNTEHAAIFRILQKYNRVNLLIPVGTTHCYHAAMEQKSVRLTPLGEHYRRLAAKGLL